MCRVGTKNKKKVIHDHAFVDRNLNLLRVGVFEFIPFSQSVHTTCPVVLPGHYSCSSKFLNKTTSTKTSSRLGSLELQHTLHMYWLSLLMRRWHEVPMKVFTRSEISLKVCPFHFETSPEVCSKWKCPLK